VSEEGVDFMNFPTIVVLAVLALAVGLALRSVIDSVKRGDLCGTCGNSCGGSCGHCQMATQGVGISEKEVEAVIESIRENKE
jgi:hypothetical protein